MFSKTKIRIIAALFSLFAAQAKADPTNVTWQVNNPTNLVWELQRMFYLDVEPVENGSIEVQEGYQDESSEVTAQANPNIYFHFKNWENVPTNVANSNPAVWNMNKPYTNVKAIFIPDITSKGIRHDWLASHGITNLEDTVEDEDPDHDTAINLDEWVWYTNPTNPLSFPRVLTGINTNGVYVEFPETGPTNRTYTLEQTLDLIQGFTNTIAEFQGTGTNKVLEMQQDKEGTYFYKGKARLTEE